MNQKMTVHDIKRGSTFRLNNEVWKVTEVYNYTWNDGSKTQEFQIKNQSGFTKHLEIDLNDDDQTVCIIWADVPYYKNFFKTSKTDDKFKFRGKTYPRNIEYEGIKYSYFDQSSGSCSYGYYTEDVYTLTYATEDRRKLFSLEIWDDDGEVEKELAEGTVIAESDISQITEGKKGLSDYGFVRTLGRNITWVILLPFIVIVAMANQCSNTTNYSNSDDPYYDNDSTRVNRTHRTNRNYYRNRNSRGYGK